jgi:hypothetical protein
MIEIYGRLAKEQTHRISEERSSQRWPQDDRLVGVMIAFGRITRRWSKIMTMRIVLRHEQIDLFATAYPGSE